MTVSAPSARADAVGMASWQDNAWEAAALIYQEYGPLTPRDNLIGHIHGYLHACITSCFGEPEAVEEAAEDLRHIGALALRGALQKYGVFNGSAAIAELALICELIAKKQHDYGHGNITRFGLDGILVRLSDKVCRLQNLTERGVSAANEAIEDTWVDIVGYCIIGLMWVRGTFMAELSV